MGCFWPVHGVGEGTTKVSEQLLWLLSSKTKWCENYAISHQTWVVSPRYCAVIAWRHNYASPGASTPAVTSVRLKIGGKFPRWLLIIPAAAAAEPAWRAYNYMYVGGILLARPGYKSPVLPPSPRLRCDCECSLRCNYPGHGVHTSTSFFSPAHRSESYDHSHWLFSRHISRTQSFQEKRHFVFHALVALKRLVYRS